MSSESLRFHGHNGQHSRDKAVPQTKLIDKNQIPCRAGTHPSGKQRKQTRGRGSGREARRPAAMSREPAAMSIGIEELRRYFRLPEKQCAQEIGEFCKHVFSLI
jgi:hypothetical protein